MLTLSPDNSARLARSGFAWLTNTSQGACLLGQKRYAEAEPLLEAGYQDMRQHDEEISRRNKSRDLELALTRLIQLCDETSQSAKAAVWRKALADFEKRAAETSQESPPSPR